jgi:hypothetical protein
MNREQLESNLIDYLDGKLDAAQQKLVEQELARSEEARALLTQLREVLGAIDRSADWQPSTALRQQFQAMLHQEMKRSVPVSGKQVFFQPTLLRAAAAIALVLVGVAVGYWINKNQQREAELAAIRSEMEATKQMMMAMLDNRQPASQRLVGVSVAYKMEQADDEIVNALVKTMNEDANTNVRLAALEVLSKFQQLPHVRTALIGSLAKQTDPVVQIELIRVMATMKEKEVLKELERITTDDTALPAVKDEAHAGILKLS